MEYRSAEEEKNFKKLLNIILRNIEERNTGNYVNKSSIESKYGGSDFERHWDRLSAGKAIVYSGFGRWQVNINHIKSYF